MKPLSVNARAALPTFVALFAIYSATLAPSVTFWDSGEFLAAIHSLGIPHPPGTPLYVLAANVWARVVGPITGFAYSVNLFSALCAAVGCALLANLVSRWMRDPYLGVAAAICAGGTSSLWMSATEAEVYAPAFLVSSILVWLGNNAAESRDGRYFVLLAYVAGLGWALHLTALIVLPAALLLVMSGGLQFARWRFSRAIAFAGLAALVGATLVFFMYIRARHDPAINQGNPSSLAALSDVIARRQYDSAGLWPRQAPLYLQLGNLFEWADWQFALGLDKGQPPSWARTPVTLLFALLGVVGFMEHRKLHRQSWRAMCVLFATATVGVVLYLNLKAGPSYGVGFLPDNAPHEARERDYFFILAWATWGLWAGIGALHAARRTVSSRGLGVPVGLLVAALPLMLNWRAVDRRGAVSSREARDFGAQIFDVAPERSVVLARGDNDTYPIWYLMVVEKQRPDIVPITVPMLPTKWYREEISRRYGLLDEATVRDWAGTDATLRVICDRAGEQSRPVRGPLDTPNRSLPNSCTRARD